MNRYDFLGIILIALLAGFVALTGSMAYSLARPKSIDPETLCPTDSTAAHTVLLVDRSDPLGGDAARLLQATLQRIVRSLGRGERFSIFLIDSDGSRPPTALFSRCAPPNGTHAHWLYENRRLLHRRWHAVFGEPVEAVARTLREPARAPISPILETIGATTRLSSFGPSVPHRTLIVASDFLQNVLAYSQYRTRPDYDSFSKSRYAAGLKTNLRGVDVELVYLLNPAARARQTLPHRRFWLQYMRASGAAHVRLIDQEIPIAR